MKNIFFLLLCISLISSCCSMQPSFKCFFRNVGEYPVPVFNSAYSNEYIMEIEDDTINEYWSEIEIVKKQGSRYKVKIVNESLNSPLIGWINKEECGVYLYPTNRANDGGDLKFFLRPNEQDPCLMFHLDKDLNCDSFQTLLVPVVDFNTNNRRIKVIISLKTGETMSLWTSDYCNRIYGCEGN